MGWRAVFRSILLALVPAGSAAADLTDTEMRWLRGAWPVVSYAKSLAMPLDIVVQPQPTAGTPPLALAFVEGRCKLVLSMRGNPEAEATLSRIEPELLGATLELMAAHELGHCRRYLDGAWHGLPSGFAASVPEGLGADLRAAYDDMRASRREEGYGDLVGLAWIQRRHPQQYARLYAWLADERSRDVIPGSPHDTLPWVRLAAGGVGATADSIFDGPAALWKLGLAAER